MEGVRGRCRARGCAGESELLAGELSPPPCTMGKAHHWLIHGKNSLVWLALFCSLCISWWSPIWTSSAWIRSTSVLPSWAVWCRRWARMGDEECVGAVTFLMNGPDYDPNAVSSCLIWVGDPRSDGWELFGPHKIRTVRSRSGGHRCVLVRRESHCNLGHWLRIMWTLCMRTPSPHSII